MSSALVYLPLCDPTAPYHSLSYLNGAATARGLPASAVVDANIEAFHHTISAASAPLIRAGAARRRAELLANPDGLNPRQRRAVLGATDVPEEDVRAAVAVLRDSERFYDYADYSDAVDTVCAWMNLVSLLGVPGAFVNGFRLLLDDIVNPNNIEQSLSGEFTARLCRGFDRYLDGDLIPRLAGYGTVGFNLTYREQLPFGLEFMRRLRAFAGPDIRIVVGGTEVADVWKCLLRRERFFEVFADADLAVVGEGESAWCEIVGAAQPRHPNIVARTAAPAATRRSRTVFEVIRKQAAPDYSDLPWHLYLSPARYVYYSPSRGCYWNECTFCDYGLNEDSPTSPWRQVSRDNVVADMRRLAAAYDVVYLSVDVLAPAMMLALADALIAAGTPVCWGAEIRLEKSWTLEKCQRLRASGCVLVSVGYESGSQRVLDLMRKGTTLGATLTTMRNLAAAGIQVQMMGFTGFPSETTAEALESARFLEETRDLWLLGGLGKFALTPGAIVAREPDLFGVSRIRPRPGDDIARELDYHDPAGDGYDHDAVNAAAKALYDCDFDRPWLGGMDTPHTYLYANRYGAGLRRLWQHPPVPVDLPVRVRGAAVTAGWRRPDGAVLPLPAGLREILARTAETGRFAEACVARGLTDPATQQRLLERFAVLRLVRPDNLTGAAV